MKVTEKIILIRILEAKLKMYTIEEITAATKKLFGRKYTSALVRAALKNSKAERFTVDEAKKIVE